MKRGTKGNSITSPNKTVAKDDEEEVDTTTAEASKKPRLDRPNFPRDEIPRKKLSDLDINSSLKIISWNVAGLRTMVKNNGGT
jgi:hypothetical protein